MKLIYSGESPSRDIVTAGGGITVLHAVPFDVDPELGARLLEQDIYTLAKATHKKATDEASAGVASPETTEAV